MKLKEPLSGFLHFIGAVLTVPGIIVLIYFGDGSAWKVVSFAIYGAGLFLLFFFSTLYHWLPWSAGGKNQVFRKLDHLAIYGLIAGTYTPFCLNTIRGPWGWSLFGVIWGMALFGIVVQAIYINVWRWLTTAIYIGMGWIVLIAFKPLMMNLPIGGIMWLVAGGVIYSAGGIVYTIKKPNLHPKFGFHELWHMMVLLGAACHYFAILFYIALN